MSGSTKLPTPLVVAAASAMVAVGVVAVWFANASTPPTPEPLPPTDVLVDDSTPERAAESFLDAWRKRAHDAARRLSVGAAREAVEERAAEDARMTSEEREVKTQIWDTMAASRLALRIRESENLDGGRIALRGTAEGEFVDQPYVREVAFVLAPAGDDWRVAEVSFGDILTDTPGVLELDDPLRDEGP